MLVGGIGALLGIVNVTNCLDVSANRIGIMTSTVKPITVSKIKLKMKVVICRFFNNYGSQFGSLPRVILMSPPFSDTKFFILIHRWFLQYVLVFLFVTSFILYSSFKLGKKKFGILFIVATIFYNICSNCDYAKWNIGNDNSFLFDQLDSYPLSIVCCI